MFTKWMLLDHLGPVPPCLWMEMSSFNRLSIWLELVLHLFEVLVQPAARFPKVESILHSTFPLLKKSLLQCLQERQLTCKFIEKQFR